MDGKGVVKGSVTFANENHLSPTPLIRAAIQRNLHWIIQLYYRSKKEIYNYIFRYILFVHNPPVLLDIPG